MQTQPPTPNEQDSELKDITEGLVKWATDFYEEELKRDAENTGIPFSPIVSNLNESIPLTKAQQALLAWRNAYAEKLKVGKWDYERLKKQEQDGLEALQALKQAEPMTAEHIVYHIAGLSPHNLPTNGVWALEQYAEKKVVEAGSEHDKKA